MGDDRQGCAEAKAVGQEQVDAASAKLPREETVPVEQIAHLGFCRGHQHIVGIQTAARRRPTPRRHVTANALEGLRVVLLDQHVAVGALEAEHVLGMSLQQGEVAIEGLGQVRADGVLQRPQPLGVQVGIAHGIDGDGDRIGLVGHVGTPGIFTIIPPDLSDRNPAKRAWSWDESRRLKARKKNRADHFQELPVHSFDVKP